MNIKSVEDALEVISMSVRNTRGLKNYRQKDLSKILGFSENTIIRIEKGSGGVSLEKTLAVLKELGLLEQAIAGLIPSSEPTPVEVYLEKGNTKKRVRSKNVVERKIEW